LGRSGDGLIADFDADGRVDLSDFAVMRGRFGSAVVTPSFPVGAPETLGTSGALRSLVASEDLRLLTDYWFTEVTSPGVDCDQSTVISSQLTAVAAPSETSLAAVSGGLELEGLSEAPSGLEDSETSGALRVPGSSEVLRSLTDYWFTEVTSPGSPVANVAATGEYDLRPLSDDPADYDLDDDLLVDILAESAFVGLRL
jgi:hypothetical protein